MERAAGKYLKLHSVLFMKIKTRPNALQHRFRFFRYTLSSDTLQLLREHAKIRTIESPSRIRMQDRRYNLLRHLHAQILPLWLRLLAYAHFQHIPQCTRGLPSR